MTGCGVFHVPLVSLEGLAGSWELGITARCLMKLWLQTKKKIVFLASYFIVKSFHLCLFCLTVQGPVL